MAVMQTELNNNVAEKNNLTNGMLNSQTYNGNYTNNNSSFPAIQTNTLNHNNDLNQNNSSSFPAIQSLSNFNPQTPVPNIQLNSNTVQSQHNHIIQTNNVSNINSNSQPVSGINNNHSNAISDTPMSIKSAITNTNTYDLDSNVNKLNLQEQDVTIIDDKERPVSPKVSNLSDAICDAAIKTNISNENMNHVNLSANNNVNMTHH